MVDFSSHARQDGDASARDSSAACYGETFFYLPTKAIH